MIFKPHLKLLIRLDALDTIIHQNTMSFATNGIYNVHIDPNGRLGIGTDSPLSPLHVTGDIDASPDTSGVHLGTSSGGTYAAMEMSGTAGGYIDFQDTNGSSDFSGRMIYRHDSVAFNFQPMESKGLCLILMAGWGLAPERL